MPIYYLDASAVLKRYFVDEAGARFMKTLLEEPEDDDVFCIASFGILEVNAAIRRRVSNQQLMHDALMRFSLDSVEMLRVIPMDDDSFSEALSVIEDYRLRAGDAIHLATALSIAAIAGGAQAIMVTSDTELLYASEAAGIPAIDPQADDAMGSLLQIRG